MTELCTYQTTNIELKNDLIIAVFYGNLTNVRKERRTHEKIKMSWKMELENVKKQRKDAKLYVIIMYTQNKIENTGG